MSDEEKICEHVLELRPGTEGKIRFRFRTDRRTSFTVGVADVNPAARRAELLLDDMWHGYEMQQYAEGGWTPLWPKDEDGRVHVVVGFGPGKHVNISSELALIHSLDLTDVTWRGEALRLTFCETA
jgi:hypothetical protein